MTVQYVHGDMFSAPVQTVVNTVNTVGVMGKGIALTTKQRYPHTFDAYRVACSQGFSVGQLLLTKEADHWILNFPTKVESQCMFGSTVALTICATACVQLA